MTQQPLTRPQTLKEYSSRVIKDNFIAPLVEYL